MQNPSQNEKKSENNNFLDLLRASNGDFGEQQTEETNYEEQNADTLRTANNKKQNPKTTSNLTTLFEPQSPTATLLNRNITEQKTHPTLRKAQQNPDSQSPTKTTLRTQRRPQPLSNRGRSVSFDKEALYKAEFDGLKQPALPETTTIEFAATNQNTNIPMGHHRTFTIEDFVSCGSYETEAETNILKAVEEHHQQHLGHQRFLSETSTILTGVPDSMVHDLVVEDIDNRSLASRQQNSNEADTLLQQTRPLIHRELKRERKHGRTKSVGDRLVGLTLAMQSLDNAELNVSIVMPDEPLSPTSDENEASLDFGGGHSSLQSSKDPLTEEKLPALKEEGSDDDVDVRDTDDIEEQKRITSDRQSKFEKAQGKSIVFQGALVEDSEEIWRSFFHTARGLYIPRYLKNVGLLLLLLIGIAAILFYTAENPTSSDQDEASISWYLIFAARQIVTLSLALATQMFVIDFLGVSTKILLRMLGQYFTLLIIMSKGWPFVVFMWSIYDFIMLCGDNPFAHHWLYWQGTIALFNEENASGEVVSSAWNRRILSIALCTSLTAVVKRFLVGVYLGRQTYAHYGEKLAKIMGKMLVISKVAHLSKKISKASKSSAPVISNAPENFGLSMDLLRSQGASVEDDESLSAGSSLGKSDITDKPIDMNKTDPLTGKLDETERIKLIHLLDRWEEPDREASANNNVIPISEILRFRNALTFINDDYPFSFAFGPAGTRESTLQSAQEVYSRLTSMTPLHTHLQFETIAYVALRSDGTIDQEKAKEAMKVFRPDRTGNLTLLYFIKSIDSVYKEFRLLQASIENSSQIDRQFEKLFNVVFYGVVGTIILSTVGVDPLALFLSFSSVIFAFAFMIGSAASKYFEGILFILVRRPYGIGDIIHVSDVEQPLSPDGSIGWIVQSVSLFETTAIWVPTLERASFSNGSLSNSRIINWAKSPSARFNINLTFPISTKYETIEIFKRAVEEYMKVRPREWLSLNGFRVQRVYTEKGYIEVILTLQHRDPWQNCGQVLDSKANLVSYCHEVQKKLGMQYHAPPVPVDFLNNNNMVENIMLAAKNNSQVDQSEESDGTDDDMRFQQFRTMAKQKYNIRAA